MKKNAQIRQDACEIMQGNWLAGALISLVYLALVGLASYFIDYKGEDLIFGVVGEIIVPLVIGVVLLYPLQLGFTMIFLKLARTEAKPELKALFDGFSRRYHRSAMGTLLLMNIYTILWTLLLIVPGIIKSIEYAMTPFIIADEPELGCNEAIEKSMQMMCGKRWQLFKIYLGMCGWMILGILTACIAWFWIIPYYETVLAKFYLELKEENQ